VHLPTRSITASKCISQLARSRCGETTELEGRESIIKTPLHLSRHPMGIRGKEQFWLKDVIGLPGREEPHKLRGSMKARQECMGPRAGKDGVCISYHEMMSIYPGVSQIYTPRCSIRLRYPVSLYAPRRLPPAKLNGGGGEKRMFPPQPPPSASLSSLNRRLHVLL